MKITIYDVANEAGLSIATVSRVINSKGGVTKKSEDKIWEAIKKLNYTPDASAQSLSNNYTNTIGLMVNYNQMNSDYLMQLLSGACAASAEKGFDVHLTNPSVPDEEFCTVVKRRGKIDGIILPLGGVEPYGKRFYEIEFPMTYVGVKKNWDRKNSNVYGGYSSYRIDALNKLFEKGCKKVLFIDGLGYHNVELYGGDIKNKELIDNLKKELDLEDAQLEYRYVDIFDKDEFYNYLISELNGYDKIDGIFYTNYMFTDQIYSAVNNSNLEVPKDIKIVTTIHSEEKGVLYRPSISAYYIDAYKIGYNAAKKLINMIRDNEDDESLSYVHYKYIERESL